MMPNVCFEPAFALATKAAAIALFVVTDWFSFRCRCGSTPASTRMCLRPTLWTKCVNFRAVAYTARRRAAL